MTNASETPEARALQAIRTHGIAALARAIESDASVVHSSEVVLEAARTGAEYLSLLLQRGADVYAMDSYFGTTPLEAAASRGGIDRIEMLLERGADVDGPLFARNTALMSAAKHGKLEIAKLLHEKGADLDRDSLDYPSSALNIAEELAVLSNKGQAEVAEFLRSVGATKPWDYQRHEDFWDGVVGELTILFVESCLGNVCATPVLDAKTEHARVVVRRARHGWKANFQTVFTSGLPWQGANCEIGVCLTSKWPLHRRALEDALFRRPVDFVASVADRLLQGAELRHGDVLDQSHPLVKDIVWPGDFEQWLVVRHREFEERREEIKDPDLPIVLLLVPHLEKKPLRAGKDAVDKADLKASVKWQKPAASGGKSNLVVPLCYDAPWLKGGWF